jgi:hypothetical protein
MFYSMVSVHRTFFALYLSFLSVLTDTQEQFKSCAMNIFRNLFGKMKYKTQLSATKNGYPSVL